MAVPKKKMSRSRTRQRKAAWKVQVPRSVPCEQCGKPARRLLNAPPIVFKGSGWYVTDSQRSLRTGVGTEPTGELFVEPPGDRRGGQQQRHQCR